MLSNRFRCDTAAGAGHNVQNDRRSLRYLLLPGTDANRRFETVCRDRWKTFHATLLVSRFSPVQVRLLNSQTFRIRTELRFGLFRFQIRLRITRQDPRSVEQNSKRWHSIRNTFFNTEKNRLLVSNHLISSCRTCNGTTSTTWIVTTTSPTTLRNSKIFQNSSTKFTRLVSFTYFTQSVSLIRRFFFLLQVGMHYIPIIDAGVSASEKAGSYPPYDEGLRDGVFIKEGGTDKPFIGKVWNLGLTAWPDFTNPNVTDYYHRMLQKTHDMFKFDGVWLVSIFLCSDSSVFRMRRLTCVLFL